MKAGILATSLLLAAITPTVFAANQVTCSDADGQHTGDSNNIYRFSADINCSVKTSDEVDSASLRNRVLAALESNGTINSQSDNGNGIALDYTDNTFHNGDHGTIQINFNANLNSNADSVNYTANSKRINATGDSALTKSVTIKINFKIMNGQVKLIVHKDIAVERPSKAVIGRMFKSRVIEGLEGELTTLSEPYKDILGTLLTQI